MADNPLSNITKIGNYALPAFGAFLTATFSVSSVKLEAVNLQYIMAAFALYTMLSAFVSYWHRILWLRHQNEQKAGGISQNEFTDLSLRCVALFLILHFLLIVTLGIFIIIYFKPEWAFF